MPPVRRLAAILAADVAGYSRLMGADEEGTHERLQTHFRELVNPKIAEHRGRAVKNTGDGLLAEFQSVVDAVRCAVEIQRGMIDREPEVPDERRIRFRIGVNLGDVIVEEHDIFGDGVNVAARLEALAEPGEICVSRVVRDQVRDRLDYTFEDLGEQQIKNITRPVRVYRVRDPAATVEEPARSSPQTLPLPDKPSIAVLPFQNMSGDREQEYFVDGIVEEITTAISRLPWLFVIARNSSFTYKGRAVDVKQVASELGVRYILEGSVRKAGNRVRITGQLVDTASGTHIWADRFDAALDDIFELQDAVASSVVGAIEPKLRQSEIERAIRKPTGRLDVWDLYLRALALRYQFTEESVRAAIILLERALAIDPAYAPAAAMIGFCRVHQRAHRLGGVSNAEVAEAVRLAKCAMEAGKADPDALWMAGYTLSYFAHEHGTAANAIGRAMMLNPNSAHAWQAAGFVSVMQSRPDAAIEAFEHAMRLSPLDPFLRAFTMGMALAHFAAGRYADCMEWADRTLQEEPRHLPAMHFRAACCALLGGIREARDWIDRALQLETGFTIARLKASTLPFPPEFLARLIEGLLKAGVPEE
jgi:TolB-like protein/class 3 adenylate cyclase